MKSLRNHPWAAIATMSFCLTFAVSILAQEVVLEETVSTAPGAMIEVLGFLETNSSEEEAELDTSYPAAAAGATAPVTILLDSLSPDSYECVAADCYADIPDQTHFPVGTPVIYEYATIINNTGSDLVLTVQEINRWQHVLHPPLTIPPNDASSPKWYVRVEMDLEKFPGNGPWTIVWDIDGTVQHMRELTVGTETYPTADVPGPNTISVFDAFDDVETELVDNVWPASVTDHHVFPVGTDFVHQRTIFFHLAPLSGRLCFTVTEPTGEIQTPACTNLSRPVTGLGVGLRIHVDQSPLTGRWTVKGTLDDELLQTSYFIVCEDKDGDGFYDQACGGDDCNDNDPDYNPAANDPAGGPDLNCDGACGTMLFGNVSTGNILANLAVLALPLVLLLGSRRWRDSMAGTGKRR